MIAFVPEGLVARQERTILLNAVTIMLLIIVPTGLATLAFAWWFRAGNSRARYRPDFAYSGRIEFITWSIPVLTILFLGGTAWISSHDLDPAQPLPVAGRVLPVQVVALDWKWLFIYPDQGVASVNRLVVPAGVQLRLQITSASVFNVFFVPQLGSEIYAMNGMATELHLVADKPGTFPGLSAHFSGDGFSDMHFDVNAVPQAQFDAWVKTTAASGPTLDDAAYRGLLRQTTNVAPYTYHAVQPGIFAAIIQQKLPPGDGPEPAVRPQQKS